MKQKGLQREMQGVEDTLYIPLAARIYASEHFPNFFYDEKVMDLAKRISVEKIMKNSIEYFHMASVCRQKTLDGKIKDFLKRKQVVNGKTMQSIGKHAESLSEGENSASKAQCNIVFLGAGLETAYDRIGNKEALFYQLDLPDVIKVREELLGKGENEGLLSGDLFALEWLKEIDCTLPTLLVVAGVFQYFHKEKILEFLRKLKTLLSDWEIAFDATNPTGLKYANKYVRKTGNTKAEMYFGLDDPEAFAKEAGLRLLSVDGFYQDALAHCKGLKLKTRLFMFFSDQWRRTMVVHLARVS